jgi:hypothetical protein
VGSGKGTILYSDTDRLQQQQVIFLTKMAIRHSAHAFFIMELQDITTIEQATNEQLNDSLWLIIMPR